MQTPWQGELKVIDMAVWHLRRMFPVDHFHVFSAKNMAGHLSEKAVILWMKSDRWGNSYWIPMGVEELLWLFRAKKADIEQAQFDLEEEISDEKLFRKLFPDTPEDQEDPDRKDSDDRLVDLEERLRCKLEEAQELDQIRSALYEALK